MELFTHKQTEKGKIPIVMNLKIADTYFIILQVKSIYIKAVTFKQ